MRAEDLILAAPWLAAAPKVMRARTLMRWPARALVALGLRFESDDLERRFAHTLRTKQMVTFILLQFAFLWLLFSVAVRLPAAVNRCLV